MADAAADRVGGAEDVVAPQQRPGGQPVEGGLEDVVGHVGQGRDQLVGRDAVGRGQQDDVEHLQRRRVQLVERAVDRTGTASRLASATTSDGAGRATSGRATSRALSCSSLRVRSQAASVAGGSVGIRSTLRRRRKRRS